MIEPKKMTKQPKEFTKNAPKHLSEQAVLTQIRLLLGISLIRVCTDCHFDLSSLWHVTRKILKISLVNFYSIMYS